MKPALGVPQPVRFASKQRAQRQVTAEKDDGKEKQNAEQRRPDMTAQPLSGHHARQRGSEREQRGAGNRHLEENLMQITVNGTRHDIPRAQPISYEAIAGLAGKPDNKSLTIVYSGPRRGDAHRSGSLYPGQSIEGEDGMIFDAVRTDNA